MKKSLPTENRFKQEASRLKKEKNIKQSEALDIISSQYGYSCWLEVRDEFDKRDVLEQKTPDISMVFVDDDDVVLNGDEYDALDSERYIDLAEDAKLLVDKNKRTLVKLGIEFSLFEPTITGLKKSILDATQLVRTHFELEQFHYYADQQQGPEYKVIKPAILISPEKEIRTQVSLYRPMTKSGDPRMWFPKLSEIARAGDQVAIVVLNDSAYLINFSNQDLELALEIPTNPLKIFIDSYLLKSTSVADELLRKLKVLALAPFPAERLGSTGIGYTLEKKLGIDANSSKLPDYKGIELKSGRGNKTRTTLFAQVADWSISACTSSAEILNKYGYQREDHFKLYCTISALKSNSQGLNFKYDSKTDQLQEWYLSDDIVAIWPVKLLRSRLKGKHAETFWVEADSIMIEGVEHFQLKSVTHTRSPILSQLIPLLVSGVITMDHLIKKNYKTNKVTEKGPLFKMNKRDLELLFPKPITYSLNI